MPSASEEQVYFKSMTLSNVRSFGETQPLYLTDPEGRPAQWTLILGENGVGKTTLLQCLASMCPVFTAPETDALTAPFPTRVEPALLRREDSELVALLARARSWCS